MKLFSVGVALMAGMGSAGQAQTFYSTTVTNDQPLLYWNFDEADGNAQQQMPIKDVTAENDLVPANGAGRVLHTQVASGLFLGRAADFVPGEEGPIGNFNAPSLSPGRTNALEAYAIEYWFQDLGGSDFMNHYLLSFDAGGRQAVVYDWMDNGARDAGWMELYSEAGRTHTNGLQLATTDTAWHHFFWVFYGPLRTAAKLDLYVDGRRKANVEGYDKSLPLAGIALTVGGYRPQGGLGIRGRLDEVALYDLGGLPQADALASKVAQMVEAHLAAASLDTGGVQLGIAEQPADATADVGTQATFRVQGAISGGGGGTPAYQWYRNWVLIPGATNSTYTTSVLTIADVGPNVFRAKVTAGSLFAWSRDAALNVSGFKITIAQQPSSQTLLIGNSATLTVQASSQPATELFYQWFKDGVEIPGATNVTYTTAVFTSADANIYRYTARIATGAGYSVSSEPAVLTVMLATRAKTQYSTIVSNDAPLLYWTFDEPVGPALQQMPLPQGATTENDLVQTNGASRFDHDGLDGLPLGYGVQFAGDRGAFYAGTLNAGVTSLEGPWGVEFWMQAPGDAGTHNDYVITFDADLTLAVVYDWAADLLEFYGGAGRTGLGDGSGGGPLLPEQDSKWHHILWVYYGALRPVGVAIDAYIDGQLAPNAGDFDRPLLLTGPLVVGAGTPSGTVVPFKGRLDELAIYSFASAASEGALATQVHDLAARHIAAATPQTTSLTAVAANSLSNLVLSWVGSGFIVQESNDVSDPLAWVDLNNSATSPVTVPIPSGAKAKFYRLKKTP
ncbi:MAG: LamG-like jellyroll fold domain-containing protein [Verrucomicrobiota bacterium]